MGPVAQHALAAACAAVWLAGAAAAEGRVAARIDGEPIALADVDARSAAKVAELGARIAEAAASALDARVDARLAAAEGAPAEPAPPPLAEGAVDAFRRARAEDFEGPFAPGGSARDAQVQRSAIRHYLEGEARTAAAAEARAARRSRHRVELLLPEAAALERPLPPDRVVARVDGAPLRAAEVEDAAALVLYRLRGELFRERMRNLETILEERLLAREAQRRGVAVAALAEAAEPTDADVEAFLAAERAAGRTPPSPERARPYLAFRRAHAARVALLARLRDAAEIEILLREPEEPRLPVETAGAAALGPEDGARLVVYSNYRCRSCRLAHAEIDRLLAGDGGVRIFFRDFVPVYDPAAREAARLARCAAAQGRFAAMRDLLLRGEAPDFGGSWIEPDGLPALARRSGLDADTLARCLDDPALEAAIDADTRHALSLGFEHAPAFVAEGAPLSGVQSAEGLARAALRARARAP